MSYEAWCSEKLGPAEAELRQLCIVRNWSYTLEYEDRNTFLTVRNSSGSTVFRNSKPYPYEVFTSALRNLRRME